jgi:hypothetical protein
MRGKHHKPPWWDLGALGERLGGRGQVSPPPGHLSEIVNGYDGWAHLVTDQAYAQGLQEQTGHDQVLWGRWIAAMSMATPPKTSCTPRVVYRPMT